MADASAAGRPLLEVEDLRVWFPAGRRRRGGRRFIKAVDGVSFSVRRGETLGLVGESGCGKTTTARAVLSLVDITEGRIFFDGVDLTEASRRELRLIRRRMQPVFQDPFASLDPKRTAGKIIAEPLAVHRRGGAAERRARAAELLETVGLPRDAARRFPHAFSGGQRQRIAIARAMALRPDLIIADEPVSALDVSIRAQILNLLGGLQKDFGLTYVMIAHDLALVRQVTDRVAVMYLGGIAEMRPTEELYRRPRHPYTIALLSSAPIPDAEAEAARRRIVLEGEVPSPADPPAGCRFHTRCWLRRNLGGPEVCETDPPPLKPIGESGTAGAAACHFLYEAAASRELQETLAALADGDERPGGGRAAPVEEPAAPAPPHPPADAGQKPVQGR